MYVRILYINIDIHININICIKYYVCVWMWDLANA